MCCLEVLYGMCADITWLVGCDGDEAVAGEGVGTAEVELDTFGCWC